MSNNKTLLFFRIIHRLRKTKRDATSTSTLQARDSSYCGLARYPQSSAVPSACLREVGMTLGCVVLLLSPNVYCLKRASPTPTVTRRPPTSQYAIYSVIKRRANLPGRRRGVPSLKRIEVVLLQPCHFAYLRQAWARDSSVVSRTYPTLTPTGRSISLRPTFAKEFLCYSAILFSLLHLLL
jgi:hypothetical protein